jgi:predicted RNase H-like nuclease (RuvC/YqgF family)
MSYPEPIIIGMDPGTTAAVAVLDTRGSLLAIKSRRGLARSEISRFVSKLGRPVLVGADRKPAPSRVEKLAAVFEARLVVPEENLSKKEKNLLARDFISKDGIIKLNQHERDALASAVFALNSIKPTMKRVGQRIRGLGYQGKPDLERYVRTRVILNRDHVKRSIDRFLTRKGKRLLFSLAQ